ncbi:hypothetical protein MP478_19790 [Chryseobacterium sp. WG14]|uniref:hypothetical protein n=1 Tax=unclassified Chryseobacterium TaxID=2593645 RepID=UPI0009D7C59E|nr:MULTISPECIES: hypothetical protein [unclassified Chryseobacterium]MCQ9641629.1 hypothetical protein [Chryseobacterium sp. WG14]SMC41987.1 hypothetical protein SAMN02787074_1157 [Chryseobacterium sp. YR221]
MNITTFIEKAINLKVNWKHYDFFDAIDELTKFFNVSYEADVEKIAVIEIKDNVVGYLYVNHPLFFIENIYSTQVKTILDKYDYIQYINVDSINHEYLSVDKVLYDKYFDYMDNTNNFSAQDFYFNNIT